MKTSRDYIILFLKGVGMGSADIVPGVSGGTIAFITGIYEELISSIRSVDIRGLRLLLKGDFGKFWEKINGNFLITLLSGILLSLFSLARVISYLLEYHPIQLWAFFFGLIVISALVVSREIGHWKLPVVLSYIIGIIVAYLITEAAPTETPENYLFVFLSGAVAICAMILPGISGSFILLILGKYGFILAALKDLNLPVLLTFALGCLIGITSFSRVIGWLLNHHKAVTTAVLAGFMIGSLNKVWPWKETVSTFVDRHGAVKPLIEDNVLPTTYQAMGGQPYLWEALLFFALGIALVVFLEKAAYNLKKG